MKSSLIKLFTIVILVTGIFSCEEGLSTMFTNIQNDTKISDNALSNDLTVMAMGTVGTDYYIACGTLKRRPVAGGDWSTVDTGAIGMVNTMATNGTIIYAGVVADNGIGTIRQLNGTWGAAALPTDFRQAVKIKHNVNFYISYMKTDGTYSLSNGGAESGFVDGLDLTNPITDMVDDQIFVCNHTVYIGGAAVTAPSSSYIYSGIFQYGVYTYVSTINGTLHRTNDNGTTWETLGAYTFTYKSVTTNVQFTSFATVDAVNNIILVGSYNYGFYQFDADDFLTGATHFSDASKTDLFYGGIGLIFLSGTSTVYIGSVGAGLWHNTFESGGWSGTWTLE